MDEVHLYSRKLSALLKYTKLNANFIKKMKNTINVSGNKASKI